MSSRNGGVIVTRVVDKPDVSVPPEQILSLRRIDFTALIGKAGTIVTGGPTLQWNAALRRYTRQAVVSTQAISERLIIATEPRSIVDPRYPKNGLVLRARDSVHLLVTGGPPPWGNIYGRCSFGFRAQSGNMPGSNVNGTPFIGFRLDLLPNSNVSDPTWKTDFVNWDQSSRRSIDTGLNSGTIRDLIVELSGVDQTIRWYVDGLLVDSYVPTANDVGGQNLTPAEWAICTEANVFSGPAPSPTFKFSFHLGVGPMVTCLYHDA